MKKRGRAFAGRFMGVLFTGAMIGVPVSVDMLGSSEMRKKIEEIDKQKKDFEVYKEEILYIEYKKLGWTNSHLLIVKKNGEQIKIVSVPEKVIGLLNRFYPEVLRIRK